MIRQFAAYYRPWLGLFWLDLGCAIVSGLLELAFPLAVRGYIDWLLPQGNWGLTVAAAIGLCVIYLFNAGLMVGRTPEYLGKKIDAYDVQMAMLYALIFPLVILAFAAVSVVSPHFGLTSLNDQAAHGLSEILYAFTSGTANNGSAFAGLNVVY